MSVLGARKQAYLNAEGADRPLKSPVPAATLERARHHRKGRLLAEMAKHDCSAILLYDPVNVRYALDIQNMNVWLLHNASRYALIFADGTAFAFEYRGSEHVVRHLSTITEVRPAIGWYYFAAAEYAASNCARWADEIEALLRQHGGGNRRLAVDKLEPMGVDALRQRGVTLVEGQEICEQARAIKSADEIALMRWTIRVAEAGIARMAAASEAGRTEQEIWAELAFENTRSGGEWLETRLLTCGQRTNPWFSECSDYVCQEGELIAFDTDMIGPYGYCADLSRAWTVGGTPFSNVQRTLYATALEQIHHNLEQVKPGVSFAEFNERSWRIPERYLPRRYSVAAHGVGMADEWPAIPLHADWIRPRAGAFQPGMTVCVESLIGEEGGPCCVKLETQVLVTETGCERLDSFPWEEV